jgi:hypothetical protein
MNSSIHSLDSIPETLKGIVSWRQRYKRSDEELNIK